MKLKPATSRRIIQVISIIILIATIFLVYWALKEHIFTDRSKLIKIIGTNSFWSVIIFIFLEAFQVVIPIIPGGITLAVGVLVFGPVEGFIYNYISICLGSLVNFYITRHFGKSFIKYVVKPTTYEKYENMLDRHKHFLWIFALLIALPVAPDDILCLIAGLTNMTYKQFLAIILICKIPSIFVYTLILIYGGSYLNHLVG